VDSARDPMGEWLHQFRSDMGGGSTTLVSF